MNQEITPMCDANGCGAAVTRWSLQLTTPIDGVQCEEGSACLCDPCMHKARELIEQCSVAAFSKPDQREPEGENAYVWLALDDDDAEDPEEWEWLLSPEYTAKLNELVTFR